MTIKQQGGVFGRNPSFNDVDVNTLDVTGQVTSGGLNVDAGTLFVDPVNNFVGIGTPAPGDRLTVNGNVYLGATSRTVYTAGSANLRLQTGTGNTIIYRDNAATEVASFTSTGLAFPNGKGIDFSATAGTGTSELFSDYEEGTWTPVDASGTLGAALAFAVGNYSKIGRMVFASFMITYPASANTNTASIGGLPFSSMTGNQTGGSAITYTDFGAFISVLKGAGNSTMLLCNASAAFLTNANMSGKTVRGTVSYMTA